MKIGDAKTFVPSAFSELSRDGAQRDTAHRHTSRVTSSPSTGGTATLQWRAWSMATPSERAINSDRKGESL